MTEHAVVISGGGPTGLMLAGELALAGIDVAIVERRASQELARLARRRPERPHHRGFRPARDRRAVSRARAKGAGRRIRPRPAGHQRFSHPAQLRARPSGRTTSNASWRGWVDELAMPIYRGREVTGFAQDDIGVDVALSDGQSLRAQYLVGCDGGRSVVRKAAGIEFPGWDPTISSLIAEVEMAEQPELGIHRDGPRRPRPRQAGVRDSRRQGHLHRQRAGTGHGDRRARRPPRPNPRLRDLSEALIAVYGTDYGIHSPTWISRFTDATRQAASYRDRRDSAGRRRRARAFPGGRTGP